jgi:hypothetical protein
MIRLEHRWKAKFEIAAREWKLADAAANPGAERKERSNKPGRSVKRRASRKTHRRATSKHSRLRYQSALKRAILIQLNKILGRRISKSAERSMPTVQPNCLRTGRSEAIDCFQRLTWTDQSKTGLRP